MTFRLAFILSVALTLAGCNTTEKTAPAGDTAALNPPERPSDPSKIVLGNGAQNAIVIEGVTQNGATYMFKSVQIERNGWLVMHPFADGKPVGHVYDGAAYVPEGISENVEISVDPVPTPGAMYLVMLHYDVNEDQVFDFGNGRDRVPDAPAFEGNTMIASTFASPN